MFLQLNMRQGCSLLDSPFYSPAYPSHCTFPTVFLSCFQTQAVGFSSYDKMESQNEKGKENILQREGQILGDGMTDKDRKTKLTALAFYFNSKTLPITQYCFFGRCYFYNRKARFPDQFVHSSYTYLIRSTQIAWLMLCFQAFHENPSNTSPSLYCQSLCSSTIQVRKASPWPDLPAENLVISVEESGDQNTDFYTRKSLVLSQCQSLQYLRYFCVPHDISLNLGIFKARVDLCYEMLRYHRWKLLQSCVDGRVLR